jgi:hypothetical protein
MMLRISRALVAVSLAVVVALLTTTSLGRAYTGDMYPNDSLSCSSGTELVSPNSSYYLVCTDNAGLWNGYYMMSNGCGGGYDDWDSHSDAASSGAGSHTNQTVPSDQNGYALMQSDGNFVLYDSNPTARWATNTSGYTNGPFIQMQNDGNLVVYYNTNVALWAIC